MLLKCVSTYSRKGFRVISVFIYYIKLISVGFSSFNGDLSLGVLRRLSLTKGGEVESLNSSYKYKRGKDAESVTSWLITRGRKKGWL